VFAFCLTFVGVGVAVHTTDWFPQFGTYARPGHANRTAFTVSQHGSHAGWALEGWAGLVATSIILFAFSRIASFNFGAFRQAFIAISLSVFTAYRPVFFGAHTVWIIILAVAFLALFILAAIFIICTLYSFTFTFVRYFYLIAAGNALIRIGFIIISADWSRDIWANTILLALFIIGFTFHLFFTLAEPAAHIITFKAIQANFITGELGAIGLWPPAFAAAV